MPDLTEERILAMIRANHLRANIGCYESGTHPDGGKVRWDLAWLDPGGTIFGPGPYAKVPIEFGDPGWDIVVRVYPTARLRKRLAKALATPVQVDG